MRTCHHPFRGHRQIAPTDISARLITENRGKPPHSPSHVQRRRVLLASVSPKKYRAYVARLTLVRYTERTIASKEKLLRLLRVVERAGYAIVDQELEIGLRSIAVPLRDASGAVVAALNASTHAQRVSMQEIQTQFLPALQAAAQELSLLLAPGTQARSFALPLAPQNYR